MLAETKRAWRNYARAIKGVGTGWGVLWVGACMWKLARFPAMAQPDTLVRVLTCQIAVGKGRCGGRNHGRGKTWPQERSCGSLGRGSAGLRKPAMTSVPT